MLQRRILKCLGRSDLNAWLCGFMDPASRKAPEPPAAPRESPPHAAPQSGPEADSRPMFMQATRDRPPAAASPRSPRLRAFVGKPSGLKSGIFHAKRSAKPEQVSVSGIRSAPSPRPAWPSASRSCVFTPIPQPRASIVIRRCPGEGCIDALQLQHIDEEIPARRTSRRAAAHAAPKAHHPPATPDAMTKHRYRNPRG